MKFRHALITAFSAGAFFVGVPGADAAPLAVKDVGAATSVEQAHYTGWRHRHGWGHRRHWGGHPGYGWRGHRGYGWGHHGGWGHHRHGWGHHGGWGHHW